MSAVVIGMTGQTGAGKSTLAEILKKHGVYAIDCDLTARRVTRKGSPVLSELAQAFGGEILCTDGSLNRAELARRAFSNPEKTSLLNSITHPAIRNEIKAEIQKSAENGEKYILLDAPTLFEAGADVMCDLTVYVTADSAERLKRIMRRDGLDETAARARMSAQKNDEYYARRCDMVLKNNDGFDPAQIDALIERIKRSEGGR